MGHLIIKPHRPYQIAAIAIILSLVFFISIWFFLDENHWNYIKSSVPIGLQTKKLWEENRELSRVNEKLQDRIVMLERLTQVDSQAAAELHVEMKRLQDELFKLRRELEFYEGVMATTGTSKGLNIQALKFNRLPSENNYNFKLILTHVTKSDKVAEGTVEITLEGIQDGNVRVMSITELMAAPGLDMTFNFKNFKRIEGNIVLPAGFIPNQVVVGLMPGDKSLSKITKVFNWSDLIS